MNISTLAADWLIRILAAVLAFMLIRWLLPLLFNVLDFPVPNQIVMVLAILVALCILFGRVVYANFNRPAV